ncbi:hypothetical protein FOL47_005431 [Perkinsus chesapeaki]|uniref:B30.2/SPRY domain-containing protein n=1 Tax=Perkinsus chesapeaki TaxID=330153 RepID=A0A7J6MZ95_PERCH|nr:hypothetical protein FOL47_005431 [Perkinsus chesapeaki]
MASTISIQDGDRDMEYIMIGARPLATEQRPSKLVLDIADENSDGQLVDISCDGLVASYIGRASHADVAAIQTDNAVPLTDFAYYFEITVLDPGLVGAITIGLTTSGFLLNRQPGWEAHSYGYRGDDGRRYFNSTSGESFGPTFSKGDTVGCLLDYALGVVRYTKNGKLLAPSGGKIPRSSPPVRFYPTVSLHSPGARVVVNFGTSPFAFDLHHFNVQTLDRQTSAIESYEDDITKGLEEGGLSESDILIRAFLLDRGYYRTLQKFDKEISTSRSPRMATSGKEPPSPPASVNGIPSAGLATYHEEPVLAQLTWSTDRLHELQQHVEDRSRVREAIVSGDIATALGIIREKAPRYSEHRPPLPGFVILITQQLVELMKDERRSTVENLTWMRQHMVPLRKRILSCNGPDMTKCLDALREACSMFAYTNIADSPVGKLLNPSRRRLVADIVNEDLKRMLSPCHVPKWSPIHVILRQLIATKQVLHARYMGSSGPIPDSRLLSNGVRKATKWVEVDKPKIKSD